MKLKKEDIKFLIIHHTGTSRDRTTFLAVKNYHTKTLGWKDIGYHYFIDGRGVLTKGRPDNMVGAHAKTSAPSMNFRSLGIALTGNFEREEPTRKQVAKLENLLNGLRKQFNIPKSRIKGHREVKSTICPGKNLMAIIRIYRQRTDRTYLENEKPEIEAIKEIKEVLKRYGL